MVLVAVAAVDQPKAVVPQVSPVDRVALELNIASLLGAPRDQAVVAVAVAGAAPTQPLVVLAPPADSTVVVVERVVAVVSVVATAVPEQQVR